MMSYTWAMSVFGMQQMMNLLTPGTSQSSMCKAGQAFDNVTDATTKTFDPMLMNTFKAGDSLQRGMVDMMFSGLMAGGSDPNRWMQMGRDAMQQMSDLGSRAAQAAAGSANSASGTNAAPRTDATAQPSSAPSGTGWGPMPR
jgi:hypothetical protein